ncbi:MAG: alpha/beta hydrolase [Alphaproteobacteria bacterium]|nr:alpha/beta hydrolase [Alphaproteobacteria bacterium]
MTAYSEHFFTAPDGVKTYYRRYPASGAGDKLPALCMHGLTRNSRDFEDVAPRIAAAGRTVIAVDVRGRGRSDYDPKPENYNPGVYVQDMLGLLDEARIERVAAVGTSMGGLMTMIMAASRPGVVASAVLNDIGPVIDPKGLKRIQGYVGGAGPFDSWDEAAEAVRGINGVAFPNETGHAFWLAFARRVCRQREDGTVAFDYDKAISQPVQAGDVAPPDLWPFFDALAPVPILLVRGALTDLLAEDTVQEMSRRSPSMSRVDVPNVGHAPLLTEPVAAEAIDAFLDRNA